MSNALKVFNGFGITPTKNFASAGYDFYIPNVLTTDKKTKINNFIDGMCKSYNFDKEKILEISEMIHTESVLKFGQEIEIHKWNLLHLFLSYFACTVLPQNIGKIDNELICIWLDFVEFDKEKNIVGIRIYPLNYVKLNSGIKVALDPGTGGVMMNRSGKGLKGMNSLVPLVDEDYTGYVHIVMQNLSASNSNILYCGEKALQMVVLQIHSQDEAVELSSKKYNEIMKDSKRGDRNFGSSNNI